MKRRSLVQNLNDGATLGAHRNRLGTEWKGRLWLGRPEVGQAELGQNCYSAWVILSWQRRSKVRGCMLVARLEGRRNG